MRHRSAWSRTPSSTLALGVASTFILVTVAVGLAPEQVAKTTVGTPDWQLRGTSAPDASGALPVSRLA